MGYTTYHTAKAPGLFDQLMEQGLLVKRGPDKSPFTRYFLDYSACGLSPAKIEQAFQSDRDKGLFGERDSYAFHEVHGSKGGDTLSWSNDLKKVDIFPARVMSYALSREVSCDVNTDVPAYVGMFYCENGEVIGNSEGRRWMFHDSDVSLESLLADESSKKIDGVFLNNVSDKMIHARTTKDGKSFVSVNVSCPQSENGIGTISISPNQVFESTRKDGTVVNGYKNIFLGKPDGTRKVSIKVKGDNSSTYDNVSMSNKDIKDMFDTERDNYRTRLKQAQTQVDEDKITEDNAAEASDLEV